MIIDKMKILDHLTIQEKYLVDYIINNQEDILKRAQVVYKLKSRNSSYSYIQYATIDFSLLEKTCDKYIEKYGC